ncbi:cuticle protein 8-like [Daphnia pulicaria]|uniref:cuticle protein 8-like n=1 Tax=Daphnia pulicaria TaxID=35523 RepID=UPI001EECD408|nr:cuticle protein 8-like [Daphnia pulicaria]
MFALIFVGLCIVRVHSYGYQQPVQYYLQPVQYQQPVQYYQQPSYTTAKPYYPSSSTSYYTTTAKPYYPTTTYPTTAYYSTTYPTTSYYTTKAYETPAAYQHPTTAAYYQTSQAYYEQQPTYTTPGYYPDNYDANENGWYNYAFKFNVNDYGNEQSRSETHENSITRGQYTVSLPDGRKQIVNYEADQNGYRAEVSYEPAGSSQYSDTENYYSTSKYGSSQ